MIPISAKLFILWGTVEGLLKKNEHRTSNFQLPTSNGEELRESKRWLKLIQRVPLLKSPEEVNFFLQETEELIKIFVTSIKTAVRQAHGPERSRRAEKKK
jgi:hypothetical protein